ncbi:hypothetical protein UFOVP142_16 [uncultured Caudovirales phage]|uniref:Uncharacterized protein n=1 Tax=uncultured Caudovirales phage TaxID=2100421 RepID=A0A6J7XNU0_9CAUD|nr:hypothetical protein UFOVP142_16 [uncultured Caudovirales phage]
MANPDQIVVNQFAPQPIVVAGAVAQQTVVATQPTQQIGVKSGPITVNVIGGAALSQLSDVSLSALAQNDVLAYSLATNKWINRPESAVTDGGNF